MRIRKRRIVERPRLFAILNDTKARIRMLVAPAGYGKTTLAEQWVVRDGRRGTWYTARSASTDVAALALGIAKSATSIVEDCDVRLRTHMRALPAPAENEQTLAEILSEDLAAWPKEAWLVIDDYHEIAQEPQAEAFVSALVALSPVQFLIASRVRPAWITTKHRLYGEALEINQAALAMDAKEAAEVLVERSEDSASGLVALANGWPAVIGLASVSSAEVKDGVDEVPESLYRFFAEEVFSSIGPEAQKGLTTLSVAPVLDVTLARSLLGADAAEALCAAAVDVGLLVERDGRLDLHPLARSFLEERSIQLGLAPREGSAQICLETYRARREWDAAFDVIRRAQLTGELVDLMLEALDDLLDSARLPTLERWCEFGREAETDAPIFSLGRAELMLRRGRQVEAIVHAEAAASGDPTLASRALSVGGRAAHLASHETAALELYERAEAVATSESQVRDAKWGQLICMIDLEMPSAPSVFAGLAEGIGLSEPREFVRAAGHGLYLQMRQGRLDLEDADLASQVQPAVNDLLVRSSFLSGYANALAFTARYDDALVAAAQLHEIAEQCRFDFALAYAYAANAMALSGLKQWRSAETAARAALARARATRDIHADLTGRAILLRLLAQQHRLPQALEIRSLEVQSAPKAAIGDFVASRALVLACAGRTAEAQELVGEARGATNVLEVAVLGPAVDAVCAVRDGGKNVVDEALRLEHIAFESGAVDFLVTAYRSCPELLPILLRSSGNKRFRTLVERVGDHVLAQTVGFPIAVNDDRRLLLTPRETEVYELLRAGTPNREIAKALFIEESTAKAHTHRIYDKLGVRSRSALAVQAALERADQATSATDSRLDNESS